ncbi:MAG: hypothetical protein ABWY11_25865 [Umezawaea sp.]
MTTCTVVTATAANLIATSNGRGNGSNAFRADGRFHSGDGLGGKGFTIDGTTYAGGGDGARDLVAATDGADGGLRVQYGS